MARAEPTSILSLVGAYVLALRNAAEMGTNPDHNEPWFFVRSCAVPVGSGRRISQIGVSRERIRQGAELDVFCLLNFFSCSVANEDRLASPHDRDGLALFDGG